MKNEARSARATATQKPQGLHAVESRQDAMTAATVPQQTSASCRCCGLYSGRLVLGTCASELGSFLSREHGTDGSRVVQETSHVLRRLKIAAWHREGQAAISTLSPDKGIDKQTTAADSAPVRSPGRVALLRPISANKYTSPAALPRSKHRQLYRSPLQLVAFALRRSSRPNSLHTHILHVHAP
ncbi:hypothetical protein CC78DRAFT_582549 [Lojkania enalia]|uniref:Uncharacterized protein n=1 Tax=Lojkania enalia TaxID=147567 RepID=A0A9P4K9D3_9PLEO|nr:hypothetical protein CC78DRAFT_582549 [Didymosphaeria enalia]